MFARIVTFPLKPGSKTEFAKVIDQNVVPLLRTHKGFRDQIAFVSADGNTSIGISFWEDRESAEAYSRASFSQVIKDLEPVTAGPAHVQLCDVTNSTAHKLAAFAAAR